MLKRYFSACLDRDMGQIDVHAHVDTKWKARAHLTFAATDEIASFLRFLLLDTAVPMLAWKQRRSESGSFQKKITTQRKGVGGCKKNNKKNKQTPSLITRPLMNQKKKNPTQNRPKSVSYVKNRSSMSCAWLGVFACTTQRLAHRVERNAREK